LGGCFIGPYALPHRLNGAAYRHFLEHTLRELLDTVPLDIRRNVRYMHDDASAHFSYATRNYLDTPYTERCIRRQGPVSWPSRSPDLNPLKLFTLGTSKKFGICFNGGYCRGNAAARSNGCTSVRNARGIFRCVSQSMHRHAGASAAVQGQHFEYLMSA
jgi:hypothetical protein